jgi:hypothetical protein
MVRNIRSEMRQRLATLIVYYTVQCGALGAYGWYMSHFLARIGIRPGLGMFPNVVVVFAVVVGSAVVLQRLLNRFALRRFFAAERPH